MHNIYHHYSVLSLCAFFLDNNDWNFKKLKVNDFIDFKNKTYNFYNVYWTVTSHIILIYIICLLCFIMFSFPILS